MFVASVVEEVVAPIPSALIVMMSGFFFAHSIPSLLFKVAIPAALGTTIGSYFVYYIAKYGGQFVIERWGKYIGLYWSDVLKMQDKLTGTRKDELLIAVSRMVPVIPSVAVSAFCGVMGMKPIKYFIITVSGVFVRSLILGSIGWKVGSVYTKYADVFSKFEKSVFIGLFVAIGVFLIYRFFVKKQS